MNRDSIIDGLRMTMDLCVFDPSTGEEIEPHLLNDISRATYDACKGALEILERLDTDSDTISRQAAIDALYHVDEYNGRSVEAIRKLPPAQPERIVRCKDCKHWIPYDWMFSEVWQSKNIADYHEDEIGCNYCDMAMKANDFCSRGERRTE